MDTRDTRRELGRSARLLVDEERWLFLGLLVGGAGYLIWLAGTGVAVSQIGTLAFGSYSVTPWSSETSILAGAFAVLWVLFPSFGAVRYVLGNITNLRGNVEQHYRFDRPLVALVPPLVLVGAGVALGAVRGAATWDVLAVLAVANTLLLVRTVAYGYRVYSFSMPRLLQTVLFVAAVVATTAIVSRTASLGGQTALVEATAARYGVTDLAFGTISRAGITAPLLPIAAVATPAAFAIAYVWVQLFASLVVRIRRPDVPRSAIRAGQRYPQVVQPGTSDRFAMGIASPNGDDTASNGTDAGAGDGGTNSSSGSAGSGAASGAPTDDAAGDKSDEAMDDVGQTRVYTPPEDADEVSPGAAGGQDAVKNEFCPICGETYAADAGHTNCPNCNAVLEPE